MVRRPVQGDRVQRPGDREGVRRPAGAVQGHGGGRGGRRSTVRADLDPGGGQMVPDQPPVVVRTELGEQGGAAPEPGQTVRDIGRAAARVDLIGRTRQPDDVGDAFADDQQVESVEHEGGIS